MRLLIDGLLVMVGGGLVWISRLSRKDPEVRSLLSARQKDTSPTAQDATDRNLERLGWALVAAGVIGMALEAL